MKNNITIGEEIKCLRCGSTNLKPANFESTGKIYSRPKGTGLAAILTTGLLVNAILCLDCGHVDLVVDASKAKVISKASCTPILILMRNYLTGIFAPFGLKKDKS